MVLFRRRTNAAQTAENDIREFEIVKWKTLKSASKDHIDSLIRQDDVANELDKNYIQAVGERWRELQRTHIRMAAFLFVIILFMGAIDSGIVREISVLGIRISKDNATLPILLLLSSILMFFVVIVSLVSDSYEVVIRSYAEAKKAPLVANYYILQFGWSLNTFLDGSSNQNFQFSAKFAVVSAAIFLIGSLVMAVILIEIMQLFIFASSIASLYRNPGIPNIASLPIVVIAICAALFSVCTFILRLPFPYTDYPNIDKLKQLEIDDPEKAAQIRKRITRVREARERRSVLVLETIVIMISIVATNAIWSGSGFLSDYKILALMIYAPIVLYFINKPIIERYEAYTIAALVKYREVDDLVKQYIRSKKRILIMRLVFAAISGVLSHILFEWAIMDAMLASEQSKDAMLEMS